MLKTGNEIIELIKQYNLEERKCSFSLPRDIYDARPTKYRRVTPEMVEEEFDRYLHGEKLVDLAAEYGVATWALSIANKKYLKQLRLERSNS